MAAGAADKLLPAPTRCALSAVPPAARCQTPAAPLLLAPVPIPCASSPLHLTTCLPQVSLHMGDAAFTGKYEPSRDGLDCVAVFDGTSFRLELLGATVKNLRWARSMRMFVYTHAVGCGRVS